MTRFADLFCGVFCDRASLHPKDLLDATLGVLSVIMDYPRFARGFKRRYAALCAAYETALLASSDDEDAFSYIYEDAYELLDDICQVHGCAVVVHPDDPTVMLIVRNSELDEWF